MALQELKKIELSSFTTVISAISVVISVILAVILTIVIAAVSPSNAGVSLYLIPTIIIGTLMITIYQSFMSGFLYNILSKKLNKISFIIDGNRILRISTTQTATMIAIISTVMIILYYLVTVFILPIMITTLIQTLMYAGQEAVAFSLYQVMLIINQPVSVAYLIVGTFIITFVFTLIGTYLYNILANSGRCVEVDLSEEGNLTVLNSIDWLKLAITGAIITGVLNVILAVIMIISGGDVTSAVTNIIGGFAGGFIEWGLIAILYNFISGKMEKIKLELIRTI